MQRQCQVRFTKSLNFIIVHSTNDFNGNESCSWFNQLEIKYVCYVQSHVHCFIVFTQICLKNTIAKIIWVRLILHIIKFAKKKQKLPSRLNSNERYEATSDSDHHTEQKFSSSATLCEIYEKIFHLAWPTVSVFLNMPTHRNRYSL